MDVTGLSDSELDAGYAAYWDSHDYSTASIYGDEIVNRLTGIWSWGTGILGHTRFPLYDARVSASGGYTQVDAAQSSVAVGVSTAVGSVKSAVGSVAGSVATAMMPVMILAAVVVWIVVVKRAEK